LEFKMGFWGWLIIVFIVLGAIGAAVSGWQEGNEQIAVGRKHGISPSAMAKHGGLKPNMICPHCQMKGTTLSKPITKKVGISGGKATGALLTGGVSLLATGL
jgi:hypothetical protein